MAPVLDVVYVSEEKEKVVPLVSNIIGYVTPYLRNHRYIPVIEILFSIHLSGMLRNEISMKHLIQEIWGSFFLHLSPSLSSNVIVNMLLNTAHDWLTFPFFSLSSVMLTLFSKNNIPSFRACSHLLSSISGYQYSRKAWRKDALELLMDPSFFQMEPSCLGYWKIIVDHLMTHDKTTFRDFLSRMSVNQSGSLKIFSSKDQEIESKAQLAKRLTFILYCSEKDQYQKYMPEIQGKGEQFVFILDDTLLCYQIQCRWLT